MSHMRTPRPAVTRTPNDRLGIGRSLRATGRLRGSPGSTRRRATGLPRGAGLNRDAGDLFVRDTLEMGLAHGLGGGGKGRGVRLPDRADGAPRDHVGFGQNGIPDENLGFRTNRRGDETGRFRHRVGCRREGIRPRARTAEWPFHRYVESFCIVARRFYACEETPPLPCDGKRPASNSRGANSSNGPNLTDTVRCAPIEAPRVSQ